MIAITSSHSLDRRVIKARTLLSAKQQAVRTFGRAVGRKLTVQYGIDHGETVEWVDIADCYGFDVWGDLVNAYAIRRQIFGGAA